MNRVLLVVGTVALLAVVSCNGRGSLGRNPEAAASASVGYDLITGEATAQDGTRMALIVRVDRNSGKSWVLKQQKLAEFGGTPTPEQLEALQVGMAWEWVAVEDPPGK